MVDFLTASIHPGKVILAGAGPGDPELISVKAVRWLQKADIILTDRLVSSEIFHNYASPKARILWVGKQGRFGISTSQKKINALMVNYARQGKIVVRLKGGDVSIFANILDELQTLVESNISYEIIPGISAALGAAACAGIPLTARNFSTAVRFLTYYKTDVVTDTYWKELAQTDDTLVFYMSSGTLEIIVEQLKKNKISSDKYLAVVEQATTPAQYVQVCSIYEHETMLEARELTTPALIIVGRVVALHEQFAWLRNNATHEQYFEPVASLRKEAV